MRKLLVLLPFLAAVACGGGDEQASTNQPQTPVPLSQSANSPEFNTAFERLLNDYYALKNSLVKSTNSIDPGVDSAARALSVSADSLRLDAMQADEALVSTARTYVQGIAAEAKGLLGEQQLEEKRKAFEMISNNMYELVRTVRYDREVVYQQYCPMAFNDKGAYWLSRESEIMNPYFGKKMLHCGEVKETLDFRTKQ